MLSAITVSSGLSVHFSLFSFLCSVFSVQFSLFSFHMLIMKNCVCLTMVIFLINYIHLFANTLYTPTPHCILFIFVCNEFKDFEVEHYTRLLCSVFSVLYCSLFSLLGVQCSVFNIQYFICFIKHLDLKHLKYS